MIETFARTPELVGLLSRYLHPQDLFICVQVSSQWHHEFIPFLWHTVDDTTLAWKSILWQCGDSATRSCYRHLDRRVKDSDKDKDREWLMYVFRKYGHHIRELSIHWPMVLEAASMSSQWHNGSDGGEGCVFLRSLTLEIKSAPVPGLRFDAADRQAYGEQVSPIPRGGWGPSLSPPPPPPVAMLPITVSTAFFPGFVEEGDFIQPEHYKSTVEFQKECVEAGWILTQHFWKLIRSSHSLKRLIIGRGPVLQWRMKSEQVLLIAIAQMPHLQELQCWGLNNMADIWKLLLAAPTLKSLTTFCRQYQLPNPLPKANMTLRTLSFLSVRCDGMSTSINNLLDVLRLFPNLSSLTLRRISSFVMQEQQQQQQPQLTGLVGLPLSTLSRQVQWRDASIGANLRELVVESITDYDALLSHLPDHVDLTCAASLGDCWPLALVERGPIFSVFRDTNPPAFAAEDDPVNELFVTSSRLRVFNSIEQCIRVDELLRQPWACMGLEWLSCRIVGVERLTDAEQSVVDRVMAPGYAASLLAEEGAAVEKFARCRAQHHGVYDQIASLIKLKHLDIGYENRHLLASRSDVVYRGADGKEYVSYAGPEFDTLELSLASGLDRLGALKDLEVFGFECINHRIGRAEVEWMAKSWPKLSLVYGLDKERLYHIEHDKERASLKDYFQQLRPDVVHDSLFEGN